jgi:GTP-binding protein HflX
MRKAVLAGVSLKENAAQFESDLKECEALCQAGDIEVKAVIVQNFRSLDQKTAFRSGKLQELAGLVEETHADLIVFYNALRVQMAERISLACNGIDVIDRTALILDIFSLRARSRQAKLQTEMARLQYDLPRVLGDDNHDGHSRGGGVTNRGGGEMRSEIISRKYQARIADLRKELQKIEIHHGEDERRRNKTMMRRAALVGYTNAGKSSLMNALLSRNNSQGQRVYEEDMLFATLDTSVRRIETGARKYLLYDTVGFVSHLPHMLVEAFHSTLDAARNADLLIHVVDASDPDPSARIRITEETLKEIGAGEIPLIRVYNKIDLLAADQRPEGFAVSCRTGEGIEDLRQAILTKLYPEESQMKCLLPYGKMAMFDAYRKVLQIKILSQNETGMEILIQGPERYVNAFRSFRI